jgi:hypothetical protein
MNFNIKSMVYETKNLPVVTKFTSWRWVIGMLARKGYNAYEVRALVASPVIHRAANQVLGQATSADLVRYLEKKGITPGSKSMNGLVMKIFGKKDRLELNAEGQVCHRGTMPGNPGAGTVLVPVGTPLCCDCTSETYWSM